MKFLKIVLFVFFLSFFSLVKAWYNYPYVCNDWLCYWTELKELNKTDNWYFMTETDIKEVSNLSNYIDSKLQWYETYYGSSKFTIDNYYSWWTWSIYDKDLTFWQLLDINTRFYIAHKSGWVTYIDETYDNWKEYLYDNFKDVIDDIHSGFPMWTKKNKLSDILWNIVEYRHTSNTFRLRNVCTNSTCEDSNYMAISYYSPNPYYFLSWTVKHNSQFVIDNFKVSNDYKVTSDTITQTVLDDIIDLTVLSNTSKKIRIWVVQKD